MAKTTADSPQMRIPLRMLLLIAVGFWVYASVTRTATWNLLAQAFPKWSLPSLRLMVVECALLLPVLLAMCWIGWIAGYEPRRWQRLLALHVSLAIVFGAAGRPALIAAHAITHWQPYSVSRLLFDGPDPGQSRKLYLSQGMDEVFQYLFLQCLVGGYALYLRYRHEQSVREQLSLQYERARLQALRARLNPHFLYNSLNSIVGFIGRDPAVARRMCMGLGDLFRRSLADHDSDFIPLGEELALAREYLEIQKLRFSDRLTYDVRSAVTLHTLPVPPLLLQPLVENAIEHSIGRSEGRVHVDVRCERAGARVRLAVTNRSDAPPRSAAAHGFGIGLETTRDRLRVAFGESASLVAIAPGPGEFRVELLFGPLAPARPMPYARSA